MEQDNPHATGISINQDIVLEEDQQAEEEKKRREALAISNPEE